MKSGELAESGRELAIDTANDKARRKLVYRNLGRRTKRLQQAKGKCRKQDLVKNKQSKVWVYGNTGQLGQGSVYRGEVCRVEGQVGGRSHILGAAILPSYPAAPSVASSTSTV